MSKIEAASVIVKPNPVKVITQNGGVVNHAMRDKKHYTVMIDLIERLFCTPTWDANGGVISQSEPCTTKSMVGCEIGVLNGIMETGLLGHFPNLRMYAIDCNKDVLGDVPGEARQRITFINKKSNDALADIKEKLDFVYIDADHTYDQAKKDMINYMPLVKPGGIIAGHDYHPHHGVIRAVREVFGQVNLGEDLVWWRQKCFGCKNV